MIDLNFLHLIHNQDLRDHIDRVGVTWYARDATHSGTITATVKTPNAPKHTESPQP